MNTLDAINNRRSIRRYLDRPVEFEKITTILDAARRAPSAGNLQDWRFIVVSDKGLIKQVAEYSIEQYWIASAPLIIMVCAVPEKHEMYYGLRGKRLYNVQDCSAAIQNILLSSVELGLGTCWVGAFEEDKIRELFAIPVDIRPQAIITIGYPDEVPDERSLVPIENIVYFNRYGMKIEKLHIVLRDYSVEWANQGQRIKSSVKDTARKIREQFNKLKGKINKNNKN